MERQLNIVAGLPPRQAAFVETSRHASLRSLRIYITDGQAELTAMELPAVLRRRLEQRAAAFADLWV